MKGTELHTFENMRTITLQSIKSHGAKAIPDGQVVYLIVNSKIKSVLIPPAEYEMLVEALEELEDIRVIEERKGGKTIEWDKVFPQDKK